MDGSHGFPPFGTAITETLNQPPVQYETKLKFEFEELKQDFTSTIQMVNLVVTSAFDRLRDQVPSDPVGASNHDSWHPLSYMRDSEGEREMQAAVRPMALADRPKVRP